MAFGDLKTPGRHDPGRDVEQMGRRGKATEGFYQHFLVPQFPPYHLDIPYRGKPGNGFAQSPERVKTFLYKNTFPGITGAKISFHLPD
jgi:hypothetical protein